MVVDDHSKRLLGAVLKDNDVLQENITRMVLFISFDVCLCSFYF